MFYHLSALLHPLAYVNDLWRFRSQSLNMDATNVAETWRASSMELNLSEVFL